VGGVVLETGSQVRGHRLNVESEARTFTSLAKDLEPLLTRQEERHQKALRALEEENRKKEDTLRSERNAAWQERDKLKDENDSLRSEAGRIRSEHAADTEKNQAEKRARRTAEWQVSALQDEIRALQAEKSALQRDKFALQREKSALQDEKTERDRRGTLTVHDVTGHLEQPPPTALQPYIKQHGPRDRLGSKPGQFARGSPVNTVLGIMQDLMDRRGSGGKHHNDTEFVWTYDRTFFDIRAFGEPDHPDKWLARSPYELRITNIFQLQNQVLQNKYIRARTELIKNSTYRINKKLHTTQFFRGPGFSSGSSSWSALSMALGSEVLSTAEKKIFGEELRDNEAILFHGTSPQALAGIATNGFAVSNSGMGGGGGIFLADLASKSDEYSRPLKRDPTPIRVFDRAKVRDLKSALSKSRADVEDEKKALYEDLCPAGRHRLECTNYPAIIQKLDAEMKSRLEDGPPRRYTVDVSPTPSPVNVWTPVVREAVKDEIYAPYNDPRVREHFGRPATRGDALEGKFVMLVVRATLENVEELIAGRDLSAHTGDYIIDGEKNSPPTYKEVVVKNPARVLPLYALFYERVYPKDRFIPGF